MGYLKNLMLIILLSLWAGPALAVLDLFVKESLDILEAPQTNSKIIVVAEPGDRFVVSPLEYGNYYKIMLVGFKLEEGYVLKKQIKRSVIKERFWAQGRDRYYVNYGVGLFGLYSDALLKKKTFTTSGNLAYEVEKLQGTSPSSGIYFDIPINNDWAARVGYVGRKIQIAGEAKPQSGVAGNNVELLGEQTYKNFFGEFKYYIAKETQIWLGFGLEHFTSNSSSFYIKNATGAKIYIPLEMPSTASMVFGALGMDIGLGKQNNIYLLPELRILQSFDSSFEMQVMEIFLGLAWRF